MGRDSSATRVRSSREGIDRGIFSAVYRCLDFIQAKKSLFCLRMSINPGLVSSMLKGFAALSFSCFPIPEKALSPSCSILPAHTCHCTGRRVGVPRTRPTESTSVAATTSIEISRGSLLVVILGDSSAACSCAE